jgi:SMC interacting uncharacterized protein involved in chromosome segregation
MEYMEQQMQNQIEAAENEREQMLCEIVKLEQNLEAVQAERDALAAQVELLRSTLSTVNSVLSGKTEFSSSEIDTDSVQQVIDATPAACLAQVRAEAVRAATAYGRAQTKYFLRSSEDILSEIEQYAESIRQEVK